MAAFVVIFTAVFTSLVLPGLGNELPYFSKPPSYYEAREDATVGDIVGSITAKDVDTGDTLTLSLDSIGDELFEIVDSGGNISSVGKTPLIRSLRLKKTLDREARDNYNFMMTVKDSFQPSNRESSTSLILIVRDVNDNNPIFQGTPYTAEIKENTPNDHIYQVSATDVDLGSAKSILYSFSDDCKRTDCEPFIISSTAGQVSLNSTVTLDYEKKNRYNLDIIAKDRGNPSLNSSTTLVVAVTDESDQPPEFEKSSYRADINETIPVGSSIVQTKASDGDRGINNPVKYAIIGGDNGNFFKIDNSTGLITTNSTIDRDTGNDFFELTVEATEIPGNASSTTTIFITIEDINDNKPTFPTSGFPYTESIPEDTPKGTPIFFQMGAVDNDREAKNARFEYSIVGDKENYFKIDPNIGRIELNRTIDFETEQQFTFVVVARETSSAEHFSANQTITVNITNVNDNEPQFNQSQYNFTLNELEKSGTVLGQITATDGDSGKFGKIVYSLSGDGAEKFSVIQDNGTVSTVGSLDFESKPSYSLKLEAKDGGNIVTRVTVDIIVTDANDNKPEFNPFPTLVNLDENKENVFSVSVKATDKDAGNNSVIRYSIVGGNPLNNFTINAVSGKIINARPLDFETQKNFSLLIMAEDQGSPSNNITKMLFIKVNDQNDNAPYFKQTFFNVTLMENTDIDYPVVQLDAFDQDSGKNAEIVYSIISGNSEKKFTIDADGLLLTRSSPDRETTTVYTLNISASDSGAPKLYAYAKVIVNILDENDVSPKFKENLYKRTLKEGPSTRNTSVANNTASDGDLGLNGTIEYRIADGNNEDMFVIDRHTGEVTVTVGRELDFETVRIYSLKIEASDKGTPPRFGEYQLVVEVLDINDNKPLFGQPEYSFTVMENRPNGTVIVTLRADDKDSGNNKLITYSFSYGNVGSAFAIDNETGQISTNKELDRETKKEYLLTVKAMDHGDPVLEGFTNVTITVLDENDQFPQFSSSWYNVSIPEGTAKRTSVFTLSATDKDDGPAGQVTYFMQDGGDFDGNNVFTVGSKSGEVKTAITLDFEIQRTFKLTVTASDNGAPSQSSNVTLFVTIKDVDDNAPTFTKNTWSAVVNENAPAGTVVTQVNATDVDFETAHRTVYYVIDSGNDDGVFGIGYENGTVYVANTTNLDRETKNSYELIIEARTLNEFKNITVQRTKTKLTIAVDDYNDYAPVFQESSYEKKIPESFELHEVIVTVVADDKDIGMNKEMSYFISSGNDEGIFTIDNATGVVTIVKRLDRETSPTHRLTVTARDHGTPSLESNVSIVVSVTDTNDKKPILIIQLTTFVILENATIGSVVAQFNATDEDLGKNAEVGYQIVSGNTDGMFGINNRTGELFTVKQLDYEKTRKYEIGVQAFDNGIPNLQSEIEGITIDVKDVNDNPPIFKFQITTMSVAENEKPGKVVGTVKGTDSDDTDILYYYIRGGSGATYFSIDESTGDVTTTAALDREKNATYFIYVQVFNSKQTPEYIQSLGAVTGTPGRRKRATDSNMVPVIPDEGNVQLVTINIADKNDNPPYFKHNFYKAGVSENAEYQSRITQITCIDNDKGNNSRLVYKVVDLDPPELLSVEPDTGWILAGQQQYFASGVGKVYSFSYSCEDPSYNATTSVTIFVLVDDQRVRLTLRINDTEFVRKNIDEIKKALDDATGLEFNVDSIQYHLQDNGKYDLSKTDIFLHAVDPKTNKVVDKKTVLKLIDTNYGRLIEIFNKYNVDAVEPKNPDASEGDFDVILAAAIALGAILFMILLCFLCVVCLMRKSHNRKLRAAKAIGSQDQSYGLTTPGTNLHVYEGSNPVWMDPYDNWKTDDDKTSSNAKLYEAQELSMDMFYGDDGRVVPGTFYESTANGAAYHPNGVLNLASDANTGAEDVTNI